MNFWTPTTVQHVTGGSWIVRPSGPGGTGEMFRTPVDGVSIDSRAAGATQAFVAVKGETFDGHDFLAQAAAKGCALVVVSDESKVPAAWRAVGAGGPGGPGGTGGGSAAPAVLLVPDTVRALQRLAAGYRRSLGALRVVGITGSNGKTTTTRLVDSILKTKLRGSASIKSFNNHIGVPLTLLAARPQDQYVVCEMGMNHAGEIAPLTEMGAPDAAMITSIGRAHIENMGSLEAIAAEKASIFNGLRAGGLAVAPADVPVLAPYLKRLENVVTFGRGGHADLRLTHVETVPGPDGPTGQRFTVNGRWTCEMPLIGEHNAMNALAAIAVARRLGLSDEEITRGLAGAAPAEMRLNRQTIGGVRVVNDAYNASPESMAAALRTFADLFPESKGGAASRRVLVLGDMLELGPAAEAAHDEVGRLIAQCCPPDVIVTLGASAGRYADAAKGAGATIGESVRFGSADDASCGKVADMLRPGDAVLLKASRRMGLERIVKALEARAAR